jgi:hypothetical protein
MDIPTRIGLGGSALFTLAGLIGPIIGWWIAGPIMFACALVAAWGFWPLLQSNPRTYWPANRIPLHVAATRAYEAAERAGVLDRTISPAAKHSPPPSPWRTFAGTVAETC